MRRAPYVAAMLLIARLAACGAATKTTATNTTATSARGDAPSPIASPLKVDGATLPAGPELTALRSNCITCHSAGLVTQQRLSAATWKAEVTKMRGFGAQITPAQEPAFVAYLARYLGPEVPRSSAQPTVTAPPITYSGPPQP
jgi:mono/diheme cytochrome c family protein